MPSFISFNTEVCVPVFASLLLYPFTPESPRWLIAVKKEKEAAKIIQQISKINKRPLPPDIGSDDSPTNSDIVPKLSMAALVSSKGLALTTFILSFNWLVVDFCYYGLSLHSVNLAGDIFTNFALSAAVEVRIAW